MSRKRLESVKDLVEAVGRSINFNYEIKIYRSCAYYVNELNHVYYFISLKDIKTPIILEKEAFDRIVKDRISIYKTNNDLVYAKDKLNTVYSILNYITNNDEAITNIKKGYCFLFNSKNKLDLRKSNLMYLIPNSFKRNLNENKIIKFNYKLHEYVATLSLKHKNIFKKYNKDKEALKLEINNFIIDNFDKYKISLYND